MRTVFDFKYYQRLLGYAHLLEAFHQSAAGLPAGLAALRAFVTPKPGAAHVDFEFQKSTQYVINECSPSLRAAWDALAQGARQRTHMLTLDAKIVYLFQMPSVVPALAEPMSAQTTSLGELQTAAIQSLIAALKPVITKRGASTQSLPKTMAWRDRRYALGASGINTHLAELLSDAASFHRSLEPPFAALLAQSVDDGSLVSGATAAPAAPVSAPQRLPQPSQPQPKQPPQSLKRTAEQQQTQRTSAAVATVVGGVSAWLSYRASTFANRSSVSQSSNMGAAIFGADHESRFPPSPSPRNRHQSQNFANRKKGAVDVESLDPFATTLRDELADAADDAASDETHGDRDSAAAATDGGDGGDIGHRASSVPLSEHVVVDPFSWGVDEFQSVAVDPTSPSPSPSSGRSNADL